MSETTSVLGRNMISQKSNNRTPVKHGTRKISNKRKHFVKLEIEAAKSMIFMLNLTFW